MGEKLYIKPSAPTATCAVHEWPLEDLGKRLVDEMRTRHGKGGVDVCIPCVERAKLSLLACFPCGCSQLKVRAGRCDLFAPDGREREVHGG